VESTPHKDRSDVCIALSWPSSYKLAVPGREHFRRAAELAGDDALKLRAGDALHLTIAESLKAQAILCLDHAMIESARLLGMGVAKT
jgi:predicted nucleic acid-binding protein